MNAYCVATYRLFDEKADFHKKAQSIAQGLTVGSWTDLPDARKTEMQKHLGQVVSVDVREPEPGEPASARCADIRIAYPDANFSPDIPALLVTVFGKLSMDGRIKLIDLHFSDRFLRQFPGPSYGIHGVRKLLGVHDRPLLMSIFKSVIGHELSGLREQFFQQALGGVDLIKDDEILFENERTPIAKRVTVCMEAARDAERHTGQKLLYAANLTGPTFQLKEQAKRAIDAGANALLFNVLAYGFDTLAELSRDTSIDVPIMAHPSLAGAYYPSPYHGISASVLLGKLMRLAGADLVLFPSPYGSVVMPLDENLAVAHALVTPDMEEHYRAPVPLSFAEDGPIAPGLLWVKPSALEQNELENASEPRSPFGPSFPVPSAGIHPGHVPLIMRDFGTDVVVNAGGGIHGHPMGTAAGGRAFRQAIDAASRGIPIDRYADGHPELAAAIDAWGLPR